MRVQKSSRITKIIAALLALAMLFGIVAFAVSMIIMGRT